MGKYPDEVQARIPSSQLPLLTVYLAEQYNRPSRTDYYLAQVAEQTARNGGRVKSDGLAGWLLSFVPRKARTMLRPPAAPSGPPQDMTDDERTARAAAAASSKSFWAKALGLGGKPKPAEQQQQRVPKYGRRQ